MGRGGVAFYLFLYLSLSLSLLSLSSLSLWYIYIGRCQAAPPQSRHATTGYGPSSGTKSTPNSQQQQQKQQQHQQQRQQHQQHQQHQLLLQNVTPHKTDAGGGIGTVPRTPLSQLIPGTSPNMGIGMSNGAARAHATTPNVKPCLDMSRSGGRASGRKQPRTRNRVRFPEHPVATVRTRPRTEVSEMPVCNKRRVR